MRRQGAATMTTITIALPRLALSLTRFSTFGRGQIR
jgi:hypothetical protein